MNPATKEIRAAGTKAHTRDRVCRVADWAWPIIWEHIRDRLPVARLFRDDLTRWTVSDWHRETVTSLKLPQYPLRNARDHWAVYRSVLALRVALVQTQLGHGSPMLTPTRYGRFMPSPADRNRWEAEAARVEAERRAVLA